MKDKELELQELLDLEGPNTPERVVGRKGTTEKNIRVTVRESRKRRESMSRLIISGMSNDAIFELMSKKTNEDGSQGFNMDEQSSRNLMKQVYAEWKEEEAERKPQSKAMAERRILRHIMNARQDKAWTAVSTLENVLSKIQGTAEPIEITSTTDSRVNEALLRILGEEDPRRIRELIESERLSIKAESAIPIAVLPNGDEVYDE